MNIGKSQFDLKFSKNNMLFKLMYVNLAVFVGGLLLNIPFLLMDTGISARTFIADWFAVPSGLGELLTKPWTLLTYMFLHLDFMHIFSNMLWLFFLGQLFVQFLGERKLYTLYLVGGLGGAVLYILSFNVFPVFNGIVDSSRALGASASVMAIVVGVATWAPNFVIRLLFFGEVKLKYIAIVAFILDLAGISSFNSGGHIAHIGGAIVGYFFATHWKKNIDITAWAGKTSDALQSAFCFKRKSKLKVRYKKSRDDFEYVSNKKDEQAQVDAILDKISRSGYDSLSKAEKDFLFKSSNRK